jgi:hypothetical protein
MRSLSRTTRRRYFTPVVEGMPLRIAPTAWMPPCDSTNDPIAPTSVYDLPLAPIDAMDPVDPVACTPSTQ